METNLSSTSSSAAALASSDLSTNSANPVAYPKRVTLSLVIPCYNEEKTLESCIEKVLEIQDEDLQLELIIVDDCSKDASRKVAAGLAERIPGLVLKHHDVNQGKGAALRTGIRHASGHFVAIQDADLEYDPMDLKRLLVPLRNGEADVVLGSRFLSHGYHRVLYFWHSLGNRFLTLLSNMLTDLNLTDMETCYKVFRREVIQGIDIEENRFGFEPEVVAKIAALRLRIYEMGISYRGRTYAEGKKIGAKGRLSRHLLHPEIQSSQRALDRPVLLLHLHRRRVGDRQSASVLGLAAEPRRLGRRADCVLRSGRRELLPIRVDPLPPPSEVDLVRRDPGLSGGGCRGQCGGSLFDALLRRTGSAPGSSRKCWPPPSGWF